MRLRELTERIGASVLTASDGHDVEIDRVCAGDHISHLLDKASETTLIVTHLAGALLVRAASLMDVPAICLLNGIAPEAEVLRAAAAQGTAVVLSPLDMFETCGHLYRCFHDDGQAGT